MIVKLKKFNVVIVIIVLIVLIILALIIKTITTPRSSSDEDITPTPIEALPTIDENSVDVSLDFVDNNRAMILSIKNIPDATESIDYEVSYTTGEGIPKGNIGTIRLKASQKEVERRGEELTLGTCSRGRCVYYQGVDNVNLSLKFNFSNGSSAIFQKEYSP
ncbi:hypothetical protein HYW54_01650 [Candidatus Gottesmanbacteria bacterium]|nr:hypothetical protein [Candidatus Gottesmanbacteria bacterium]